MSRANVQPVPGAPVGAAFVAFEILPDLGRCDATGPTAEDAIAALRRRIALDRLGVLRPQMTLDPRQGAFGDRSSRFALWRTADPHVGGVCLWIGLNPSTAGAATDDPTTRKIAGFTRRWGFGRFTLANLWPFRATDPRDLFARPDLARAQHPSCPIRLSEVWLLSMAARADRIVCAWGAHGAKEQRSRQVAKLLTPFGDRLVCLGRCANGEPRHPVRLAYNTEVEVYAKRYHLVRPTGLFGAGIDQPR